MHAKKQDQEKAFSNPDSKFLQHLWLKMMFGGLSMVDPLFHPVPFRRNDTFIQWLLSLYYLVVKLHKRAPAQFEWVVHVHTLQEGLLVIFFFIINFSIPNSS